MHKIHVGIRYLRLFSVLIILAMLAVNGSAVSRVTAQGENPYFIVFPEWEWFDGLDWPDGVVSISVDGKSECSLTVQSQGSFFNGGFPVGCDIVAGDTVRMDNGVTPREHVVLDLAVVMANAVIDTVAGTADPGAEVNVWVHGPGPVLTVVADITGAWQADFSLITDLVPGMSGRSQINDAAGNGTAVDWMPPKPWLIAFPENNAVEAWEFPDGAEVTLTIEDAPGQSWVGVAHVTDWDDPRTYLRFELTGEYDLSPGDVVTLTSPAVPLPIEHTVIDLAITLQDEIENIIAGTAPAGSNIDVWPHGYDQAQIHTTAGLDNQWGVDFDDVGFDLLPGIGGRSQIIDASGNATAVDWGLPQPFWRDEFEGSLAEGWTWMNENADKWNLAENPGFLRIYSSPYGSGGENLLLRSVAPGDFAIETRVLFEPTNNFQFAGLYIYGGEGNSLALGRAFCDLPENCVGNGIYFDAAFGGEWTGQNFATPVNVPNEAYLRLERRGEMVRGFFSYEGVTWFEIGTHWLPPDFTVMGVGLTNAQDFFTPEWDIPADFDYFELTEHWGFLPEGFHDYQQGDVPAWECVTGGWAVDPDDRLSDIFVEITVDGSPLPEWLSAGEYRPDLEEAGLCVNGSCGFSTTMWDKLSFYEPHLVTINAQDLNTGEWVRLSASDKTLTCRTYDIYSFDPISGEIMQITNLPGSDEYNPDWSPNGKKVAHDVIYPDGSFDIYITDTTTGVSTQLIGAENGNDAVWSPNGKWIAFDRTIDDQPGIFIVPSAGGTPQLIRTDAVSANWAPNGRRLVFMQPSDGSIRTVPVMDKGGETLIADQGYNPAWSPDGNWIAYEYNGDIWKVPVNIQGSVLGHPVQVTSLQANEGQPSWSMDSQTIVYHAGLSQDYDLWSVPASGGEPAWLNGAPEFGDYDPSVSLSDGKIAYASFSPQGQAPRSWIAAFTYDLPADFWAEGDHAYRFSTSNEQTGDFHFNSSVNNPRYDGKALMRPLNIWVRAGESCDMVDRINILQPTQFHVGWTTDGTYAEALENYAGMHSQVSWDDAEPVDLLRHEVFPYTSQVDWWAYVCNFTAGPPRMDLRVNYGHDWVESFYEAGHAVTITVYENDLQTVKATAVSNTEAKDFWGGSEGFQTTPEEWSPAPPDLLPGDWVYAEVDNGAVARVQLGEIAGQVDVNNDVNTGTINAPWIDRPVQVECLDWGSGSETPFANRDGGWIMLDGAQEYSCSWAGEWDVLPWQDIGVGYFTPDGHWVANAFRFEAWMGFWTYDIPEGTFEDGAYQYQFDWYFSQPYEESKVTDLNSLTIDSIGADFYDGKVLIGPWSYRPLFVWTGEGCGEALSIRADQPARFVFGWVNDISMTYEEALEHFNSFVINVSWTGPVDGSASLQNLSELQPFTTPEARADYLCSFTDHP